MCTGRTSAGFSELNTCSWAVSQLGAIPPKPFLIDLTVCGGAAPFWLPGSFVLQAAELPITTGLTQTDKHLYSFMLFLQLNIFPLWRDLSLIKIMVLWHWLQANYCRVDYVSYCSAVLNLSCMCQENHGGDPVSLLISLQLACTAVSGMWFAVPLCSATHRWVFLSTYSKSCFPISHQEVSGHNICLQLFPPGNGVPKQERTSLLCVFIILCWLLKNEAFPLCVIYLLHRALRDRYFQAQR